MSKAIRSFLAGARDQQVAFLADLVRTPSDNPPGDCGLVAARVAARLEALGLAVVRHDVPQARARAAGMASVTNLIVRHRFGPGPTIALNAHGDAVPPGAGWSHDPYSAVIDAGLMYGRGVAVSKSDIATYTWALLSLLQRGGRLAGTVELHFTFDEESGGEIGPGLILAEGLSRPDLAICAGFSYSVVTAHDGCLHLEVQLDGRSAHAARPATGIDALEAANTVLSALYASRKGLASTVSAVPGIGAAQLTVGMIEGGTNTNVVPDRVTLRLDRRIIPEEDPAAVEAALRSLIAQAGGKAPGVRVTVTRRLLATPLVPSLGSVRLAALLARHAGAVFGTSIPLAGVPLYTDARHYAAHGVPVVLYGAGPPSIEDANAHRADECLVLADLLRATEVVALTLHDLLRPDGPWQTGGNERL